MTKKLFILPFVLAIFLFASCDNSITYPKASVDEVETAVGIISSSLIKSLKAQTEEKFNNITPDSTITITVTDVEIEPESDLYATFSYTLKVDLNSAGIPESASIDLSISGSGPVVTASASINIPNGFDPDKMSDGLSDILDSLIITVNGHDMTEDFIDEITLIISNM